MFKWIFDIKNKISTLESKFHKLSLDVKNYLEHQNEATTRLSECEKYLNKVAANLAEQSIKMYAQENSNKEEEEELDEPVDVKLPDLPINRFVEAGKHYIWLNGECFNRKYYQLLCVAKVNKCTINIILDAPDDVNVDQSEFPREIELSFHSEDETKRATRLIFEAFEKIGE